MKREESSPIANANLMTFGRVFLKELLKVFYKRRSGFLSEINLSTNFNAKAYPKFLMNLVAIDLMHESWCSHSTDL